MALTLYIGNKNYSSWSMRPWVLMRQANIPFTEKCVRLDYSEPGAAFKKTVNQVNPAGKVPVLIDASLGANSAIWDSLAVCEYLTETYPELHLGPRDKAARARARSVCAEVHSGLVPLRSHCPMNIEAHLPEIGARLLHDHADLRANLQRVVTMWQTELTQSGGPMLFGAFSIADAFFAPVCMRIRTYGLPLPEDVQAYVARMVSLPSVSRWMQEALAEKDFIASPEPYRSAPQ